jgi:hypothetical protein
LWPSFTTAVTTTGFSPTQTSASVRRVRRHSTTSAPATASASSAWNASRFGSGSDPVAPVATAEIAVNAGP